MQSYASGIPCEFFIEKFSSTRRKVFYFPEFSRASRAIKKDISRFFTIFMFLILLRQKVNIRDGYI